MKRENILKQTAHRKLWVELILTILITGFAVNFNPISHLNVLAWSTGTAIITYLLVHFTATLTTKIIIDDKSDHAICIPDHYTNSNQYIPFDWITHVEVCEYRLIDSEDYVPKMVVDHDYYYQKKLFGYEGTGLIICSKIPHLTKGDPILRGIRFPAPKAHDFLAFINENL